MSKRVLHSCHTILNSSMVVLISGLVALVLNLLLPEDGPQEDEGEVGAEVVQDLEIQQEPAKS